jgi:hypothetical protein
MKLNYSLIGSAFVGGIVLSLIELTNMLKQKESPDIYFLSGLLIAGILGIAGALLSGAQNLKTAFACGVSAPQLFGGLVKAGSAGAQAVGFLLMPLGSNPVYATPNIDSTTIMIVKQNMGIVQLKTKDSVYTIEKDTCTFKIKYQDTVLVDVKHSKQKIALNKEEKNTIVLKETETIMDKFFRGITAQKSINKGVDIDIK